MTIIAPQLTTHSRSILTNWRHVYLLSVIESSRTQVIVAGASITLSHHIKSLGVTIHTSMTSDNTQKTSARLRTFTHKVFSKYEGLLTSRSQMPWPVLSSASGWTTAMRFYLGCLDRTWTSCNMSRTALLK